jgi:hypothetical protein
MANVKSTHQRILNSPKSNILDCLKCQPVQPTIKELRIVACTDRKRDILKSPPIWIRCKKLLMPKLI